MELTIHINSQFIFQKIKHQYLLISSVNSFSYNFLDENVQLTKIFVFLLEPDRKYVFSLMALNENNGTVVPEEYFDFQMPSEGKIVI